MKAVDYLERIQDLDALIDCKIQERQDLLERATSLAPNMDGMPHGSGVSDKVGSIAARMADKAAEIDRLTDLLVDYRDGALALLEKLPPLEYLTLHCLYVRYMTRAQTAEKLDKSERQIYRIRGRGLKRLQGIIDQMGGSIGPIPELERLKTTN